MFKALFKLVIAIISQPGKAWVMLKNRYYRDENREIGSEDYESFLSRYLYPFIGLITVAAFLSICTRQEFDIELALKSSIVALVSSLGGYHLSAYLLNEVWGGYFRRQKELKRFQVFVGYSSALQFSLCIILLLLPDFFFLRIFIVYTFYIVWEGVPVFLDIEDELRMKFTIVSSVIILASPYILEFLLLILMPGLRS